MKVLRSALFLSTLAWAFAACGTPGVAELRDGAPVPAVAAERFEVRGGCDELFVAHDREGTVALVVRVPGILERGSGLEVPYREELPVQRPETEDDRLVVRLEEGTDLAYHCTDVLVRPPRIDAAWVGVGGTATVTLVERLPRSPTATGDRPPPTVATVRLDRVVLAPSEVGGAEAPAKRRALPDLEIRATLGVPGGG